MPSACCVLNSFFLATLHTSSPTPSKIPRCMRREEAFDITMIGRRVRAVLYNGRGHFAVCTLLKSQGEHEKVTDSTSAGWSWYICRKTVWQGLEVGYYYGSQVYTDLCRRHRTMLTCGERFMKATRQMFQKLVIASMRKSWIGVTLNMMCELCYA